MDGWEAAIGLLLGDLGGQPVEKIADLIRRHDRPERGLTCWGCSQHGVPWPCVPLLIAREAQFRLRLKIPAPREATP